MTPSNSCNFTLVQVWFFNTVFEYLANNYYCIFIVKLHHASNVPAIDKNMNLAICQVYWNSTLWYYLSEAKLCTFA